MVFSFINYVEGVCIVSVQVTIYLILICVSHSSPDIATRQIEYDKFIAKIHNPPIIVMASSLIMRERVKSVSATGIMKMKKKEYRNSDRYTWAQYTEQITNDKTYYYVCLNKNESVDKNGEKFDIFQIKDWMDKCGIPDIENIEIYGVRKTRIKEIAGYDNWVWIEDKLKTETAKITDDHVASLIATELLDSFYNRVYTSEYVAEYVGPDSHYSKYVLFSNNTKRIDGNIVRLTQLCKHYGNALKIEEVD